MGKVNLTGRLICKSDAEAANVRNALPEHIRLTRDEPGCLGFDVSPSDSPLIWHVAEQFADSAAFEAHKTRAGASAWGQQTLGIERDYTITEDDA